MPSAAALSEGTLLGLQSSIGLALAQSLDVQGKSEALVSDHTSIEQQVLCVIVQQTIVCCKTSTACEHVAVCGQVSARI